MRRTATGALLIGLMACNVTASASGSGESKDLVACDADRWSDLIGQAAEAADIVPEPKRIIPPMSAVTRDYRIDRTNVDLDSNDIIVRIWCG